MYLEIISTTLNFHPLHTLKMTIKSPDLSKYKAICIRSHFYFHYWPIDNFAYVVLLGALLYSNKPFDLFARSNPSLLTSSENFLEIFIVTHGQSTKHVVSKLILQFEIGLVVSLNSVEFVIKQLNFSSYIGFYVIEIEFLHKIKILCRPQIPVCPGPRTNG